MKNFLILILSISACTSFAIGPKKIYLSAGGSDLNDGLSTNTPWLTISKLNSNFATIAAGDSILFRCGDKFVGSIMVGKSGTPASPIVITSYGTGAKPIISGLTSLSGWSNMGGNVWQCSAPTLKSTVNIVLIDGNPHEVGRTPNNNYYPYQSATETRLTGTFLFGATSYVGAEIVIKKNSYTIVRSKITAQSAGTVTYIPTQGIDNANPLTPIAGIAGFGYFLERYPGSLDQFGEWYFDPSAKLMQMYSATDPSSYNIQASFIDTLLILGNRTNIFVNNLAFEGAGMYGTEAYSAGKITIQNCSFNNNTRAIYYWNGSDLVTQGNFINNSFNSAITVGFNSTTPTRRVTVMNNTITNTGLLVGIGVFPSNNNLKAIVAKTDTTNANNFVTVKGNTILNTGYMGIEFQGSNVAVRENHVRRYCMTLDDGGGIYSFKSIPASSLNFTNRIVEDNIVGNAIGSPDGTNRTTPDVAGIYYDEQTDNTTTQNNTIFDVPGNGFQMNAPLNMQILNNTVYNCDYGILLAKKAIREVSGVVIKHNTIYQKTNSQYNFFHINANLTSPSTMTIAQSLSNLWDMDSNFISNLKTAGYGYYYSPTGAATTFPPAFNLSTWQNTYGHDVHSVGPPLSLTVSRIEVNPTDSVMTVDFPDSSMIDPQGVVYNQRANIPRHGNRILMYNGPAATTNVPPVAHAGQDKTIVLPTNSVALDGSGTDDDGTINIYGWVKTSGPSAGSIDDPTSPDPVLQDLVEGEYEFELTVTDNDGASAKDKVHVTVQAAPIGPCTNCLQIGRRFIHQ